MDKAKGSMNDRIQAALKQMAADKEASSDKDSSAKGGQGLKEKGAVSRY